MVRDMPLDDIWQKIRGRCRLVELIKCIQKVHIKNFFHDIKNIFDQYVLYAVYLTFSVSSRCLVVRDYNTYLFIIYYLSINKKYFFLYYQNNFTGLKGIFRPTPDLCQTLSSSVFVSQSSCPFKLVTNIFVCLIQ